MRCIALEVVRTVCTALQRDTAIADEAMVPIKEALEQRLSNESGLFAFFQHLIGTMASSAMAVSRCNAVQTVRTTSSAIHRMFCS
jgi:hypothetical protein